MYYFTISHNFRPSSVLGEDLAGLKEFWQNFSITSESPEILSWNFHPVNKVSLETLFCQKAPLSNSCTCAKDSFWNMIRLYGLVIWHFKFDSEFLQFETAYGLETFHVYTFHWLLVQVQKRYQCRHIDYLYFKCNLRIFFNLSLLLLL